MFQQRERPATSMALGQAELTVHEGWVFGVGLGKQDGSASKGVFYVPRRNIDEFMILCTTHFHSCGNRALFDIVSDLLIGNAYSSLGANHVLSFLMWPLLGRVCNRHISLCDSKRWRFIWHDFMHDLNRLNVGWGQGWGKEATCVWPRMQHGGGQVWGSVEPQWTREIE